MFTKYRSEIDGIRALAVAAVVLYHAEISVNNKTMLTGGFLGVDVFFVISGYLITLILLKEINRGEFTFSSFYERRSRRILPALFTVMLASVPFAFLMMTPKMMQEYAGSILSSLAFGSNFWFWLEDSYTAEVSSLKPFLHTWSLSVEEQFYIFFPILLILVYRYANNLLTPVIIATLLVSLQVSHSTSSSNVNAAFYLLPYRGWELLAGALLAKLELNYGRSTNYRLNTFLSTLGLALISYSIFAFDDSIHHPSYLTLLPIFGTMALIWCCGGNDLITRLLSSKPLVGIGLISYSLYLWHFPIFAFARIHSESLSNKNVLLLILLTVVLSTLSYYLIERPARHKSIISTKRFTFITFIVCLLLISLAYLGFTFKITSKLGYQEPQLIHHLKIDAQLASKTNLAIKECETLTVATGHCYTKGSGDDLTVIWGDSHAQRWLTITPDEGERIIFIHHSGCPPVIGVRRYDQIGNHINCSNLNLLAENANLIKSLKPKRIILVSRWTLYMHGMRILGRLQKSHHFLTDTESNTTPTHPAKISRELLEKSLIKTIHYFNDSSEVIFVSQVPDLQSIRNFDILSNKVTSLDKNVYLKWHQPEFRLIEKIKPIKNTRVINLGDLFCGNNCLIRNSEGILLYKDNNHLSPLGADYTWKYINNVLNN